MTAVFAWICAAVAAIATLGAAYFFDKSADEHAAVANERASAANEKASQANERAAQLEKEAAEARLKLAQLQQVAPRLLMPADQSEMSEALAKFSGQQAEVGTTHALAGTSDVQSLSAQISGVLKAAGWKVGPTVTWGADLRPIGVIVSAEPDDTNSKNAALALVDALGKASITAEFKNSIVSGPGVTIRTRDGVTVLIGTKL